MFCVANFLVHPAHRGVGLPLAKAMVDLPHLLVGMPNSDSAILWTHLDIQVFRASNSRTLVKMAGRPKSLLPRWVQRMAESELGMPTRR